jgi:hypothetical protein
MMKPIRLAMAGTLAIAAAAFPAVQQQAHADTATPAACSGWTQVASPNAGTQDNALNAVSAGTATDIWAVGTQAQDTANPVFNLTLAEHFNGTAWTVVPSPDPGPSTNALFAVSTLTSGRAWAVGNFLDAALRPRTLVESWDGTRWAVDSSPNPAKAIDLLFGVSAVSPTDVWAVGYASDSDAKFRTLTEHWDGHGWSVVPSPNPGPLGDQLFAVHAVSSSSVWAVGQQIGTQPDRTLVEHWNGTAWSVVSAPRGLVGDAGTALYSVTGVSDNALVAAGATEDFVKPPRTLVAQGKGTALSVAKSQDPSAGDDNLDAVAAASATSAWAVGSALDVKSGNELTLVEHRDASGAWRQQASPSPGFANGDSQLGGVTAISPTDVWAVGAFDGPDVAQTLILHFCG